MSVIRIGDRITVPVAWVDILAGAGVGSHPEQWGVEGVGDGAGEGAGLGIRTGRITDLGR